MAAARSAPGLPLLLAALVLAAAAPRAAAGRALAAVAPKYAATLLRCSDASSTGGATFSVGCGGDTLTSGAIGVNRAGRVIVNLKGASTYNLYEVYWLPFGASFTSAKLIGNIVTDCNGNSPSSNVRPITTGAEALASTPGPLLSSVAPALSSGVFVLYSRGPYGSDGSPCRPTKFNTVASPTDTSTTNALANPVVGLSTAQVQFVSGYSV